MSIAHLLDHTCNVWSLSETTGDYAETVPARVLLYEGVACTFQRRNTVLSIGDPGTRPVGDRRVYFDTGLTFRDRDIIEIVSGPEVDASADALLLEVESVANPRGHHTEIRATEWLGELPAVS